MKDAIRKIIMDAAKLAYEKGSLPSNQTPDMDVEEPKYESHGDFSTNFALVAASLWKMPPKKIAAALVPYIETVHIKTPHIKIGEWIEKVEIAGPGFINFFLSPHVWTPVVDEILQKDYFYGSSAIGRNEKIQVEFVSSNPTGPLHVGHGRGAAIGDALGNILAFSGFDVQREYYINDSGRQIRTLGTSVWLRLLQKAGKNIDFPHDCYQGDYIKDLAAYLFETEKETLFQKDEAEAIDYCAKFAASTILEGIREDLAVFGVNFDRWFSEQSLYDSGKVQKVIEDFKSRGLIYEADGALWFKTGDFGDEKDRVVVRNNGLTTYFASDIAYHMDKFERGFSRVIDIWGADHHGYINRIKASVEASGRNPDQFQVILVRLVSLSREGKPVAMSTRTGEFVTLKEIIDEVGKDAARFLFLSRSYDSGLDFDLELAKKQTADNPVYYVQYVHARISSILSKAVNSKAVSENIISKMDFKKGENLELLTAKEEINLLKILGSFEETIRKSALELHPHIVVAYMMNLAAAFHLYYNRHKVITDKREMTLARLSLILAVKKVIRNGLSLLGVSAPEKM
jgi:arginyl-tRNA synthetase